MLEIQFDAAGDLSFDLDLTPYVLAARWSGGLHRAGQTVAEPGELRLRLDDRDGVFSPVETVLPPGRWLRVRGDGVTLYQGRLTRARPAQGVFGTHTISVQAFCPVADLMTETAKLPLLLAQRVDQALATLFDQPQVAYPYQRHFWMIDTAGVGRLDVDARLFESAPTSFDAALTTLAFVGDQLRRATRHRWRDLIRDLVDAEVGGRFFWDARAEQFVFQGRDHDALNATPADTMTTADLDGVRFGVDAPSNQVQITFQPRTVGAARSVLWQDTHLPVLLRPGEDRRLTAGYFDSSGTNSRVGGVDMIDPAAGTDYAANALADGTGTVMTRWLRVQVSFHAADADVRLINLHPSRSLYITLLQLRGTPVSSQERRRVSAQQPDSIAAYERRTLRLNLPAVDDDEFAQAYADLLAERATAAVPAVTRVWFEASTPARQARATARQPGDRITLTLDGHNAEAILIGEAHQVALGRHRVTWDVIPAEARAYWRLDDAADSLLDVSTRLML